MFLSVISSVICDYNRVCFPVSLFLYEVLIDSCSNRCTSSAGGFLYIVLSVFGKQMDKETKLRIHNITAKAALKFGSEAWVLKKREEQRSEAAQMKFLRHLLGITKLDKEKNQFDIGT